MRSEGLGRISDGDVPSGNDRDGPTGLAKDEPAPLGDPERPELLGSSDGAACAANDGNRQHPGALRLGSGALPFVDLLSPIERLAV